MVKLGSKVRDTVTGYEGQALGRAEHLYGCVRIAIEPDKLDKEGKPLDPIWFDEQRVEVIKVAKTPKLPARSIKLGSYVKDAHTGFEGMAVAWTDWLYGKPGVTVEPTTLQENGKPKHAEAFSAERLEVVKRQKPQVQPTSSATSGGPQNDLDPSEMR